MRAAYAACVALGVVGAALAGCAAAAWPPTGAWDVPVLGGATVAHVAAAAGAAAAAATATWVAAPSTGGCRTTSQPARVAGVIEPRPRVPHAAPAASFEPPATAAEVGLLRCVGWQGEPPDVGAGTTGVPPGCSGSSAEEEEEGGPPADAGGGARALLAHWRSSPFDVLHWDDHACGVGDWTWSCSKSSPASGCSVVAGQVAAWPLGETGEEPPAHAPERAAPATLDGPARASLTVSSDSDSDLQACRVARGEFRRHVEARRARRASVHTIEVEPEEGDAARGFAPRPRRLSMGDARPLLRSE